LKTGSSEDINAILNKILVIPSSSIQEKSAFLFFE